MDETAFACLLFIDADIEFAPADVARLWNLCHDGADVAVGPYRHKKPDAGRTAWVGGELKEVAFYQEPFEVDYAGTGFFMVKRSALERLQILHPEWEYQEGFPLEGQAAADVETRTCWAFFQDPIEDHGSGRFHLSEDYFFCKRVREAGMRVIMDPGIELKHWGLYAY